MAEAIGTAIVAIWHAPWSGPKCDVLVRVPRLPGSNEQIGRYNVVLFTVILPQDWRSVWGQRQGWMSSRCCWKIDSSTLRRQSDITESIALCSGARPITGEELLT